MKKLKKLFNRLCETFSTSEKPYFASFFDATVENLLIKI